MSVCVCHLGQPVSLWTEDFWSKSKLLIFAYLYPFIVFFCHFQDNLLCQPSVHNGGVRKGRVCGCWSSDRGQDTGDMQHATCDTIHTWHLRCDTWNVIPDSWHMNIHYFFYLLLLIFFVSVLLVSLILSAHVKRFRVSCMQDFWKNLSCVVL